LRPLIYLELRHLINAIKFAAKRPKRLIPAFTIGLWIIMSLVQSLVFMSNPTGRVGVDQKTLPHLPTESIKTLLVVLLTIGGAALLYSAFSSGMMVFSLAHIDFLFPLPVRRRSVLLLKLAKDYIKYACIVSLMYLILGPMMLGWVNVPVLPWGLMSIAALTGLIIFFVNTANVISIVFTFGFERLSRLGTAAKLALILIPVGLGVFLAYHLVMAGGDTAALVEANSSAVIRVLLAPVSWTASLSLAPLEGVTIPDDYMMLAGIWALALISFLLLIARKENIYEPSLGVSVRYARRRQAIRSGGQVELMADALREKGTRRIGGRAIPPFGRGATAFLWKNLLVRYRLSRKQMVLMFVMPLAIIYVVKVAVHQSQSLQFMPLILFYAVWVIALSMQGDARADLKYANITKSIPVASWKLVLAQTASYALFIVAGTLVFGGAMLVLLPEARTSLALAAMAGAPFLGFVTIPAVLIPSILYPDSRDMVQNYLCGMFSMLFSGLSIAPAAVAAGLVLLRLHQPPGWALAAACAVMLATSAVGIGIAGIAYEKFEPTGE
jgi:hypothetical protein